jgi:hypothetical protein
MARVPGTTLKPRIRLAAPRNANLLTGEASHPMLQFPVVDAAVCFKKRQRQQSNLFE